jgi:hypothetical protein
MGSGASAENARTTVAHLLTGKPADASDIKVSLLLFFVAFKLELVFRTLNKLEPKLETYEELPAIFRTN